MHSVLAVCFHAFSKLTSEHATCQWRPGGQTQAMAAAAAGTAAAAAAAAGGCSSTLQVQVHKYKMQV
jgi:hypothetical protein